VTNSPSSLRTLDLVKSFGGLRATDDVSLSVDIGEIHALIGPNGAGKTTILNQLSGQLIPSSGSIYLDDSDITDHSMARRTLAGISRSFQITAIFEPFTVRANLETALYPHLGRVRRRELRRRTDPLLTRFKLTHIADTIASELSHGQKRQVDVAMALAGHTRFVLLDEPFAGLDPAAQSDMVDVIEDLRAEHGILLVEHDIDATLRLADRVTVLHLGRVLASGSPDEIRSNPEVRRVYLGEN